MVTCSKTQQQAISRTAASCVKSHVNKSTESDEPSSSVQSGRPVTLEQISSLFQAFTAALSADIKAEFQAFRAALKAEFQAFRAAPKAELQAPQAAITSRLDTMQSSMTTIQTGLKDMQNKATELDSNQFDNQTAMLSVDNAVKTEGDDNVNFVVAGNANVKDPFVSVLAAAIAALEERFT